MHPKLSIITVNLNNAEGLKKTIESVVNQTFTDYEYIIIDGGSTDGSVDIIKQYADKITYWVSEPDKGIYNGMNKGILKAKGEYCLFLNSGDYLFNEKILSDVFYNLPEYDIVYGNGYSCSKNDVIIKYEIPEKLKLSYFYSDSIFHASTFIKKELFEKFGLYNEENKIVSDWEFFIKTIFVNNVHAKKIPYEISVIEEGGISRSVENKPLLQKEIENVLRNYFSPAVLELIKDYENIAIKYNKIINSNSLKYFMITLLKKIYTFFKRILKKIRSIFFKKYRRNLKNTFSEIYIKNSWGGKESASGPGSDLVQTKSIIEEIPNLIIKHNIKKITDAPCGDFFWMSNVISKVYDYIDSYIGIDIVDKLIAENKIKYKKDKINFFSQDLTKSNLNYSDLIICRDLFLHLSYKNIFKILENFKKSGSQFLLVSTYTKHENYDVNEFFPTGRALNLETAPFNFEKPLTIINENCTESNGEYSDKSLMLIRFENIDLKKIKQKIDSSK